MASALDHFLNALDIALKAGDRRAEREAQAAQPKKKTRIRGFGEKRPDADPSCCIVKRDQGPGQGGES